MRLPCHTGVNASTPTEKMLRGFTDDLRNNATSISNEGCIEIDKIPFSSYAVYIYFSRDTTNNQNTTDKAFSAYEVNNKLYAGTGTKTSEVSSVGGWGAVDLSKLVNGKNSLVVEGQTAETLRIYASAYCSVDGVTAGRSGTDARGCIAGLQIVNTEGYQRFDYSSDGVVTKKLSEMGPTSGDSAVVRVILASGSTLEIDGTYTLAGLDVVSEGAVTIKATAEALANIESVNVLEVIGGAALEFSNGTDLANRSKFIGLETVKKVGSEAYSTTTEGFANQQLIVAEGTASLDVNLTSTIATADKPMTVTGKGALLEIICTDSSRTRIPSGGTIRAEDGATFKLHAVNPFPDHQRPYIELDNATFKVDCYSGSHMKVNTITMENNASVEFSGTAEAWKDSGVGEGLVIDGTGKGAEASTLPPAQITVLSGTNNKIGYASGAYENAIEMSHNGTIGSGIIEVAASAKLTADVIFKNDLLKKGAGELEMPQARARNTEIQAGKLSLTGVTGDLTQAITGVGTLKLTATGDVTIVEEMSSTLSLEVASGNTITLGVSRPTIASLAEGAKLVITPTAEEIAYGRIVLPKGAGVALSTTNLTVTGDENYTIDPDDGSIVLSLTLPTWKNGSWKDNNEPKVGEDFVIDLGTGGTCTWAQPGGDYGNLVVKGSGTIQFTGSSHIGLTALTLPDDVDVNIEASGSTLRLKGMLSGTASLTWKSGTMKQENGSIIASDYNGSLTLDGGTWQWGNNSGNVNASATFEPIAASVTINTGATLALHPWGSGVQGRNVTNKVQFLAPLILNGGTLHTLDGSYGFASIWVKSNSKLQQNYDGKGMVIQSLFGAADLTFHHTPGDYDNHPAYLAVWNTYEKKDGVAEADSVAFTGKLLMRSNSNNYSAKLHSDATTGFNKALIDLGDRTVYVLTANASAGALIGSGAVESDTAGTERALTIGGYTGEGGAFSGSITNDVKVALAEGGKLNLTGTLGTVSEGTATYERVITLAENSLLSLGLANPTTLTRAIAGTGALNVTGETVTFATTTNPAKEDIVDITVKDGHTLVFADTRATESTPETPEGQVLAEGSSVTVEAGGVLELKDGLAYITIGGAGKVLVTGDYLFGAGGQNNTLEAPVEIKEGATLGIRAWAPSTTGNINAIPSLTVNGTLEQNSGDLVPSLTIASTSKLSGKGTISLATTFEDGAMLDTVLADGTSAIGENALEITGAITYGDKLKVNLADEPADTPVKVLAKTGAVAPTSAEVYVNGVLNKAYGVVTAEANDGLYVAKIIDKGVLPVAPTEDTSAEIKVGNDTVKIEKAAYDKLLDAIPGGTTVTSIRVVAAFEDDKVPTAQEVQDAINALEHIEGIVSVKDGVATISYVFGITSIEVVDRAAESPSVKITVEAKNADTNLKILTTPQLVIAGDKDETPIEGATVAENTTSKVWTFTVPISSLYDADGNPKIFDVLLKK